MRANSSAQNNLEDFFFFIGRVRLCVRLCFSRSNSIVSSGIFYMCVRHFQGDFIHEWTSTDEGFFLSCLVTVMILGVTILRKRYPLAKYLCVLLIVTGVALFLYKPNKSTATVDDHIFGFGEILLVSDGGIWRPERCSSNSCVILAVCLLFI